MGGTSLVTNGMICPVLGSDGTCLLWLIEGNDIYFNAGNVGIGNDSPDATLHVSGDIKIGAATQATAGTIQWTGSNFQGYDGADWNNLDSAGGSSLWTDASPDIYFSGGKVGINTSSPSSSLDIGGEASSKATLTLKCMDTDVYNGQELAEILFAGIDMGTEAAPEAVARILVNSGDLTNDSGNMKFATQNSGGSLVDHVMLSKQGCLQIGDVSTYQDYALACRGNQGSTSDVALFYNTGVLNTRVTVRSARDSWIRIDSNEDWSIGADYSETGNLKICRAVNLNSNPYLVFDASTVAVSIGTTTTSETLNINGGVKVTSAIQESAGTIQWNGSNFQGHDGTNWLNLDTAEGAVLLDGSTELTGDWDVGDHDITVQGLTIDSIPQYAIPFATAGGEIIGDPNHLSLNVDLRLGVGVSHAQGIVHGHEDPTDSKCYIRLTNGATGIGSNGTTYGIKETTGDAEIIMWGGEDLQIRSGGTTAQTAEFINNSGNPSLNVGSVGGGYVDKLLLAANAFVDVATSFRCIGGRARIGVESAAGNYGDMFIRNQYGGGIDFYTDDIQRMTLDSTGSLSFTTGAAINEFSIDGTMTDNSDDAVPTEKAVRTFVENYVTDMTSYVDTEVASEITDFASDMTSYVEARLDELPGVTGYWDISGSDIYYNSGDVGIGTSSPDERLHIKDASGDGAIVIGEHENLTPEAGTIEWNGTRFQGYTGSDWTALDLDTTAIVCLWDETIFNSLYTDASVGIGKYQPSHKLHVEGNIGAEVNTDDNIGPFLTFSKSRGDGNGVSSGDWCGCIAFNGETTTGVEVQTSRIVGTAGTPAAGGVSGYLYLQNTRLGGSVPAASMIINDQGWWNYCTPPASTGYDIQIALGNNLCFSTSDGRQKTNQLPIPYGLAEIEQLEPKIYDFHNAAPDEFGINVDTGASIQQLGLVAQEVHPIIPEVCIKPDYDYNQLWNVDYKHLVPVLVKAIQELSAEVNDLKAQLAAL